MVISNTLLLHGFPAPLVRAASVPSKLFFGLSGNSAVCMLFGLTGGYPVGVKPAAKKQDADREAAAIKKEMENAKPTEEQMEDAKNDPQLEALINRAMQTDPAARFRAISSASPAILLIFTPAPGWTGKSPRRNSSA